MSGNETETIKVGQRVFVRKCSRYKADKKRFRNFYGTVEKTYTNSLLVTPEWGMDSRDIVGGNGMIVVSKHDVFMSAKGARVKLPAVSKSSNLLQENRNMLAEIQAQRSIHDYGLILKWCDAHQDEPITLWKIGQATGFGKTKIINAFKYFNKPLPRKIDNYRDKIKPNLGLIKKMSDDGANYREIGERIGVSNSSMWRMAVVHPDVGEALGRD